MAGIYGNMLDSFPELFRTVKFWSGQPKMGAGYDLGPSRNYQVIVLADMASKVVGKKVKEFLALDISNSDVLYSNPGTEISLGLFFIHPDDGQVYRVVSQLDYAFVGGFNSWGVVKAQGATGINDQTQTLKEGVF